MSLDRRALLQHLSLSGLAITGASAGLPDLARFVRAASASAGDVTADDATAGTAQDWDITWTSRLTGRHKAVYDCPDIGGGLGVLRSGIVTAQYMEVFKVPASAISNVIVLRHDGIMLAMRQAFWDAYGIGAQYQVTHPWTGAPLTRNPALLGPGEGLPAGLERHALDQQLTRGVVVLACALAFRDVVDLIATRDGVPTEAATTKATSLLIPGIIMQPSGVFAANVAQEHGCVFVRAT